MESLELAKGDACCDDGAIATERLSLSAWDVSRPRATHSTQTLGLVSSILCLSDHVLVRQRIRSNTSVWVRWKY